MSENVPGTGWTRQDGYEFFGESAIREQNKWWNHKFEELKRTLATQSFFDTDWHSMLEEFHTKFEQPMGGKPHFPSREMTKLRTRLIEEEVGELYCGLMNKNMVQIADGLADAIYVIIGTALTYGIDLRSIFVEVHRTNMAKLIGNQRHDGKILKDENWEPPRIKQLLKGQGWDDK